MPPKGSTRMTNFTLQEVRFLVTTVMDRLYPEGGEIPVHERPSIWANIGIAYEQFIGPQGVHRSVEHLKKRWSDFKTQLKRKLAKRSSLSRQSGSGPLPSSMTLTDLETLALRAVSRAEVEGFGELDSGSPERYVESLPPLEPTEAAEESSGTEDLLATPEALHTPPRTPQPEPPRAAEEPQPSTSGTSDLRQRLSPVREHMSGQNTLLQSLLEVLGNFIKRHEELMLEQNRHLSSISQHLGALVEAGNFPPRGPPAGPGTSGVEPAGPSTSGVAPPEVPTSGGPPPPPQPNVPHPSRGRGKRGGSPKRRGRGKVFKK